jgi:hypothetical protein
MSEEQNINEPQKPQLNIGAVSTRFIYDCGIKYAYELAKKENAELNVETAMMIAKDYTKHVVDFLSQNKC